MKAAILENLKLTVRDVPVPEPGYQQALVKLTTAGVCHSDVHMLKGHWPKLVFPFPIPLGHEGIGIVEKLGPGGDMYTEKYVKVGDRVILGMGGTGGGYWCGACDYCLSGKPRLCQLASGIVGAYSEYITVWTKSLVVLPDSVGDENAPLACAGLTGYCAVKKLHNFGIIPGSAIAIFGAGGGLGHYALQTAKLYGYTVVGVDIGKKKLEFMQKLGADYAVEPDEAGKLVKDKFKGVHASIAFTPNIKGFNQGLEILRRGALFVGVGMPPASEGEIKISPLELLRKDTTIISSAVGSIQDMKEIVQLVAEGKIKTHIYRKGSLSEVADIIEELENSPHNGRAIITDLHK